MLRKLEFQTMDEAAGAMHGRGRSPSVGLFSWEEKSGQILDWKLSGGLPVEFYGFDRSFSIDSLLANGAQRAAAWRVRMTAAELVGDS